MHGYRFALRPGWLVLHLVCVALIVTMILLGRWQIVVSEEKHFNIRNFGYALQWWIFSAFVVVMWARIVRDHARRTRPRAADVTSAAPAPTGSEPVAYRRYVMPAVGAKRADDDPVHEAYNDYLARLNAEDA